MDGWILLEKRIDGEAWRHKETGLLVIKSKAIENDGQEWIHVSMSHKIKMPTYEDMKFVKDLFIGKDKLAIQIFPKEEKYINIHSYCLHLWSTDIINIPDFTRGGQSI